MAKHFTVTSLTFVRKTDAIAAAALDGLYIITRTSVPPERLDAACCVHHYKWLLQVERALRHFALAPHNSRSQGPSHPPPGERSGIAGRTSAEAHAPTFTVTTPPNPLQRRALDLIDQMVA